MNAVAVNNSSSTSAGKAAWICLIIGWAFFMLPIPGLSIIVGSILNLVAFILAIVAMSKAGAKAGIWQLLASIIITPVVYLIGLTIFAGGVNAISEPGKAEHSQEATTSNSGTDATSQAAEPVAQPPLKANARELFSAYQENEVAADQKYKGRLIEVSGAVAGINKDFTDSVYVELATSNQFMSIHTRGIKDEVAANLKKGQKVIVICTGAGMVMGSPVLDDCTLQ